MPPAVPLRRTLAALCAAACLSGGLVRGTAAADELCVAIDGAGGLFCKADDGCVGWRPLPPSLLFKPFMAGVKAPRMAGTLNHVDGGRMGETTLDGSLGARVGLLRYGRGGPDADGWQLDVQGAAFPRLNLDEELDLDATDFRVGIPLSYRRGATAISIGYDHISTHVGDEFLERNPFFQRVNYSRDAIVLGLRQGLTEELTVYGEASAAFFNDGGSEPLAFQFGGEYFDEFGVTTGGPVAAANVQMRQEHDFGGRFTALAGWQWREPTAGRLLRLAGKFEAGKTPYYELFEEDETAVGLGLFYDF